LGAIIGSLLTLCVLAMSLEHLSLGYLQGNRFCCEVPGANHSIPMGVMRLNRT